MPAASIPCGTGLWCAVKVLWPLTLWLVALFLIISTGPRNRVKTNLSGVIHADEALSCCFHCYISAEFLNSLAQNKKFLNLFSLVSMRPGCNDLSAPSFPIGTKIHTMTALISLLQHIFGLKLAGKSRFSFIISTFPKIEKGEPGCQA